MRTTAESHEPRGGEPAPALAGDRSTMAVGPIVAGVAGLLAAWAAAGSLGVMAHPLRHVTIWLCLATALLAAKKGSAPVFAVFRERWPLVVLVFGLAVLGIAWPLPLVNLLAVCLVLAVLAKEKGQEKGSGVVFRDDNGLRTDFPGKRLPTPFPCFPLAAAAFAAAGLAAYRLACEAIPAFWFMTDRAGYGLGWLAGRCFGQPLRVGASFAGLDFLAAMGVFYGVWLGATPPPRRRRAVFGAAAILVAHFVYLAALAYVPVLLRAVPPAPSPVAAESGADALPVWYWGDAVRATVPWNLPVLAAVLQAIVAALLFRWTACRPEAEEQSGGTP